MRAARLVLLPLLVLIPPLSPGIGDAGDSPPIPCADACRDDTAAARATCRDAGGDASTCAASATAVFETCADVRCAAPSATSCADQCESEARDGYVAGLTPPRDGNGAGTVRRRFRRCLRTCAAVDAAATSSVAAPLAGAAVGGGAPKPSTQSSPKLPRCLQAMTTRPLLADYAAYIAANVNVQQAMNPCKISTSILNWFFAKLEAAEQTGLPPSAPLPDGFSTTATTSYVAGGTQSDEILGAKLAHVFWVEVRKKVPWRLATYGSADLKRVFTLCKWPHPCHHDGIIDFAAQYVLDHSPQVAWSVLQESLDLTALTDARHAVAELLEPTRGFVHGAIYYDVSGNVVRDDTWGIRTLDEMLAEKVSRHGCWSMVPYAMQLAAALNIPVDGVTDYFAGLGHATALFPATDQVLAHGDDVYNALLANTPTSLVLDSYARWQSDVLSYAPGSQPAAYNSQTNDMQDDRLYPSAYLMQGYCGAGIGGRAYLDSVFTTYATASQLDALAAQIVTLTNDCTTIPADDP